jgi:hypothetical protein
MRSLAVLLAAALGLAAVCMVVFGTTQKQLQIGVLLGLWAGLIGAFLIFGARRGLAEQAAQLAETEQRARELHEAQLQLSELQRAQLAAADEARARQEVELRKLGEIQLSREVAARREADLHLELSLRREIERMMNEQIGLLREEVAALRAEVVDKLGGQLRLERIETTRLIGSDLEALQHEIRRLVGQEGIGDPAHSLSAGPAQLTSGRSITVGAADSGRRTVDGWGTGGDRRGAIVESQPAADWSRPAAEWSEPTAVQAEPGFDRPAWSPEPVIETAGAAAEPPFDRQPAAGSADQQLRPDPLDVFAGLPRLTPLPADLDLIPDSPAASPAAERPAATGGYHGRRRAADEDQDEQSGGGRRRAPDDAPDDLFARLRRS